LLGLDSNDALRTRHLHDSVGSMDDCHELEEERSPKDAVVAYDFDC
jgi:hypothetical protein